MGKCKGCTPVRICLSSFIMLVVIGVAVALILNYGVFRPAQVESKDKIVAFTLRMKAATNPVEVNDITKEFNVYKATLGVTIEILRDSINEFTRAHIIKLCDFILAQRIVIFDTANNVTINDADEATKIRQMAIKAASAADLKALLAKIIDETRFLFYPISLPDPASQSQPVNDSSIPTSTSSPLLE